LLLSNTKEKQSRTEVAKQFRPVHNFINFIFEGSTWSTKPAKIFG